jgi:hypothetical protein
MATWPAQRVGFPMLQAQLPGRCRCNRDTTSPETASTTRRTSGIQARLIMPLRGSHTHRVTFR